MFRDNKRTPWRVRRLIRHLKRSRHASVQDISLHEIHRGLRRHHGLKPPKAPSVSSHGQHRPLTLRARGLLNRLRKARMWNVRKHLIGEIVREFDRAARRAARLDRVKEATTRAAQRAGRAAQAAGRAAGRAGRAAARGTRAAGGWLGPRLGRAAAAARARTGGLRDWWRSRRASHRQAPAARSRTAPAFRPRTPAARTRTPRAPRARAPRAPRTRTAPARTR